MGGWLFPNLNEANPFDATPMGERVQETPEEERKKDRRNGHTSLFLGISS
jgi:hypothetical protein